MIHPSLRRKKPITRSTRPRRVRKGSKAAQEREADKLFSLYIRKRDECCQIPTCGATTFLQCAHHVSRRYRMTRWDEDNASALCRGCHYSMTFHPLAWERFLEDKMGTQKLAWLKVRAQMDGGGVDIAAVLVWLRRATGDKP